MSNPALICVCCGQKITARAAKPARKSFVGYDDFVPAFNVARHAAAAALGHRWQFVPGASIWARLPAAWVRCTVYGRVSTAPRDHRMPAAQYWPGGTLPIGPEYAAPDVAPVQLAEAA